MMMINNEKRLGWTKISYHQNKNYNSKLPLDMVKAGDH